MIMLLLLIVVGQSRSERLASLCRGFEDPRRVTETTHRNIYESRFFLILSGILDFGFIVFSFSRLGTEYNLRH